MLEQAHPLTAAPPQTFRAEFRATLALAWPLAAANLLQMLVHAIDVLFVTRLGETPLAASSLGISVFRMKLLAYALGAVPAGLAGALFANLDLYISPHSFGFGFATTVLAASILGGSASIYGAIIGALIMGVLNMGLSITGVGSAWQQVVKGLVLLAAVAFDLLSKRRTKVS